MNVREQIKNGVLLMDGSMGSYLSTITGQSSQDCELAVLEQRDIVKDIHQQYLEAGSQAILTNTYNANRVFCHGNDTLVHQLIHEAVAVAREAAEGYDAEIFGDIGPIKGLENGQTGKEYSFVARQFIDAGIRHFVFETNSSAEGIPEAMQYIRENTEDAFIIVMFAVQADGYSLEGYYYRDLIRKITETGLADAVGLNCISGAREMRNLFDQMEHEEILYSFMPSAGSPIVVDNRVVYESDPQFFGRKMAELAANGARILGGCCGTTPEHIRQVARFLVAGTSSVPRPGRTREKVSSGTAKKSAFWEKLQRGEKVIAVELDPPMDADLTKFVQGAYDLKESGADVITIADCPVGRVRMDSSLLACKLEREVGVEALPHLTCRDRNINATKALLLGLYAEGIKNILLVTGDPVPSAERDEVKAVYQFNSRKLATFVASLGETILPEPFHMFGALNVNARNFDIQLQLAQEKERIGMTGFLTQPLLSPRAVENLKRARKGLNGYILAGLFPPVSARNARFMDSEVNGIRVSPEIIEQYEDLDREESERLAVSLMTQFAREAEPYVNGYYLMTPFSRTALIQRIIGSIREEKLI